MLYKWGKTNAQRQEAATASTHPGRRKSPEIKGDLRKAWVSGLVYKELDQAFLCFVILWQMELFEGEGRKGDKDSN